MNSPKTIDDLSTPDWLAVEPYVASFESAIGRGEWPAISGFLPDGADRLRESVLIELIRVDLELRRERQLSKSLDSYRHDFPELCDRPRAMTLVAFEEYRLRVAAGEKVAVDDYADRYGIDVGTWPSVSTNVKNSIPRQSQSVQPRPAHGPHIGETFQGFKLVEQLGKGAFGSVFLAKQPELSFREVVVKVTPDTSGEPQNLARLQHAAIVPIYSVHKKDGWLAFVMPFFGRATLQAVLKSWGTNHFPPKSGRFVSETICHLSTMQTEKDSSPRNLDTTSTKVDQGAPLSINWSRFEKLTFVDAALWITAELTDGLAHAHQRGILHRDIKPANILLADDGQPMLLDFHLAADTRERFDQSRDFVGGTLPYMAPEQIDDLLDVPVAPDPRSDIYSMGVVLHEILLRRLPHQASTGNSWRTSAENWLTSKQTEPKLIRKEKLPPAVISILSKCLTPNPSERYQSAEHLGEDLRRHLGNLPLKYAPDFSLLERLQKFTRRHPRLSSTASVSGIAAVMLLLVSLLLLGVQHKAQMTQAQLAFVNSQCDIQTAFFTLPQLKHDPIRDQAAREACDRLEQRYHFISSDDWDSTRSISHLPLSQQRELRQGLSEVLILWQRSLAHGANLVPDEPRKAELRAAANVIARRLENIGDNSRLSPHFGEVLQALSEIDGGHVTSASDRLQRLTHVAPRHPVAWSLLAQCLLQLGRYADAERALTVCIGLWPEAAWPYADRGVALKELGQLDEAISDLSQALSTDPEMTHARINRGIALMQASRYVDAHADFDAAIVRIPESARIHFLKSEAWIRQGEMESAAREQAIAMSLPPDDDVCWTIRGLNHLSAGKADDALADFDAALRINPFLTSARQNKAHVLSEIRGKPGQAIEELTHLLESQPDFAPALRGRGVLFARLGQRTLAIADARKALTLDSGPESSYQIGGIFATFSATNAEDRAEAIRLLSLSLNQGYGLDLVENDPELKSLSDDPEFRQIVTTARTRKSIDDPKLSP
jgi:serine/threonine protein kinase/tetratricopeptide (TPR) repeat protein